MAPWIMQVHLRYCIHLTAEQKYRLWFVPPSYLPPREHVAARVIHDPVENVREDWTTG
jgi:hypothetical protein